VPDTGNVEGGGVPRINYVSATTDVTTGKINFYSAASPLSFNTYAASGSTNFSIDGGSSTAWTNAIYAVVAHYAASDTYQKFTVFTNNVGTVTFRETSSTAVAPGDKLYLMTLNGSIIAGVGTKEINGNQPFYNGFENRPILVEATGAGTNSPTLNLVSGLFQRQR
jgi:hypothetical protein